MSPDHPSRRWERAANGRTGKGGGTADHLTRGSKGCLKSRLQLVCPRAGSYAFESRDSDMSINTLTINGMSVQVMAKLWHFVYTVDPLDGLHRRTR
jgi:hypothetical protein